jgi:hypothetical protein
MAADFTVRGGAMELIDRHAATWISKSSRPQAATS